MKKLVDCDEDYLNLRTPFTDEQQKKSAVFIKASLSQTKRSESVFIPLSAVAIGGYLKVRAVMS